MVLSRGENLVLDIKTVSTSTLSHQMCLLISWFLPLYPGSSFTPLVPLQFPELLSALLLAEQKVGCSLRWRLHEKLLQRYSCLARLLPGELLHQNFSPRIFIILTTNVRLCDTTGHHQVAQVSEPGSQLTSSPSTLSPMTAEGAAGPEGGCPDLLHVPALQQEAGAAAGDDGATDPRSGVRRWPGCAPGVADLLTSVSLTCRSGPGP